jgi:hypothetical protein
MAAFLSATYLHITTITGFLGLPSHCFFTANAITLLLVFVRRYGSVYRHNLPSHHLHHKFVLSFAMLFTAKTFTLRLIFVKRYGSVSLYNLPSHHLLHSVS